ncbi:MAG: DUF1080 domain-containing protein [Candidatus Solibacter usitatus]|nr:DUF1080 domain-containing protein [Candidatus Solibacter usitatus]
MRWTFLFLLTGLGLSGADETALFNGKNLDGWESVGDGLWSVMRDGVLLGQRPQKALQQAWLYTKKDFREFDLSLEYWTRDRGNSGVSIRDTSRGRFACGTEWNRDKTPSHIGYEIQIWMGSESIDYPSGSIYLFDKAKTGAQIPHDWNRMDIESRDRLIRVKVNGKVVSEHAGDPARSKSGPIGLQLHDPASLVMFRNIRIREIR